MAAQRSEHLLTAGSGGMPGCQRRGTRSDGAQSVRPRPPAAGCRDASAGPTPKIPSALDPIGPCLQTPVVNEGVLLTVCNNNMVQEFNSQ